MIIDGITIPSGITIQPNNTSIELGSSYGGGYYAGTITDSGVNYYLIVAPKALGETNTWAGYDGSYNASIFATLIDGPQATSVRNSTYYNSCYFCANLTIGGFSDWYLPSRDELELCYRTFKPTSQTNNVTVRDKSNYVYPINDVIGDTMGINRHTTNGAAYTLYNPGITSLTPFISGGSESFSGAYWSSSVFVGPSPNNSKNTYWYQVFSDGEQRAIDQRDQIQVRAVRRVAVS